MRHLYVAATLAAALSFSGLPSQFEKIAPAAKERVGVAAQLLCNAKHQLRFSLRQCLKVRSGRSNATWLRARVLGCESRKVRERCHSDLLSKFRRSFPQVTACTSGKSGTSN